MDRNETGITVDPPEVVNDIPGLVIRLTTETDLEIRVADAELKREETAKEAELNRKQKDRLHWVNIIQQFIKLFLAIAILVIDPMIILWVAFSSTVSAEAKQWLLLFLGGLFGTVLTYVFGPKEKESFKIPHSD